MDKAELAEIWQFPWPVMDVLIGGQSSIDLTELRVTSLAEATEFLRAYGYDPEERGGRQHLHCVLIEAIAFIERQLLTPREWRRGIRPPDEVLTCDDPRQLLLWASAQNPQESARRAWACAVLRVMHTIAHIEGVMRTVDLAAAREQIFDRFRAYLFRGDGGSLWFGGEHCSVELSHVEWKEGKGRNSIILKLLHKRDNVAETIYDYLGVRLVTKRLCDVMMVVKILHDFNLVVYPNAYPARARNTLIDVPRFKTQVETLRAMLIAGSLSVQEFAAMVGRLTANLPVNAAPTNPHSASAYHSIQLTGRQLIKVPNYRFEWLEKLKGAFASQKLPANVSLVLRDLQRLVEGWNSVKNNLDVNAFFPFEVQILDAASFAQALSGEANHDRYKSSQVRAARKRVLAQVLETARSA